GTGPDGTVRGRRVGRRRHRGKGGGRRGAGCGTATGVRPTTGGTGGPTVPDMTTPAAPQPPLIVFFDGVTYTYAGGPGYWSRHESAEEFTAGETAGLWGPRESAIVVTDPAKLAVIRDLCLRGAPKGDGGETPPYQGGARVGRGYLYLDEFQGATPADQLRDAISRTSQAIVPLPGTIIDVGNNPIVMPARKVIKGLGGPQNEFKGSWPVYFRGGVSAFRNAPVGSNYGGNKGW